MLDEDVAAFGERLVRGHGTEHVVEGVAEVEASREDLGTEGAALRVAVADVVGLYWRSARDHTGEEGRYEVVIAIRQCDGSC